MRVKSLGSGFRVARVKALRAGVLRAKKHAANETTEKQASKHLP